MVPTKQVFISHTTSDDAFVAQLRAALELHKIPTWADSRQMSGGDELWLKVVKALAEADAAIFVFSNNSINSDWVFRELDEALKLQKVNGKDTYRVIPLMFPGVKQALVKRLVGEDVMCIPIDPESSGSLQEAMPAILAALGIVAPNDLDKPQIIEHTPIAELVLVLSNPLEKSINGGKRITAKAKLEFEPPKARKMTSSVFDFESPIGIIEAEDIRWYLEQYLIWPSIQFQTRAKTIEANLPKWGGAIYNALFEHPKREKIFEQWQQSSSSKVELRFSVQLAEVFDTTTNADEARAAGQLLSIPWELLHDDKGFLFQGNAPVRVRRSLPTNDIIPFRDPSSPLRILLVSPRPEGPHGENWLDPRASALPLVEAVEGLGDLVSLTVLSKPNFLDFVAELNRASDEGKPYDVVHFDGHGIYDKNVGLGALLFESSTDSNKLAQRNEELIHANMLGAELQKHNIPLVFLEACQTSKTEANPSASVAASLLQVGVASVVSMSHSVYVVTAAKFVKAFYENLAEGHRIGSAMLAGQSALFHDKHRFVIPGIGKVDLQDWFIPVLFQDKEDPVLFRKIYTKKGEEGNRKMQKLQLGDLPEAPAHQFLGRDRELLYLERLLQKEKYAVIRGIGGMGKTTLANELARWLVRTKQFERAAFISLETHYEKHAILQHLGSQLTAGLSAKALSSDDEALKEIARALNDFSTLIVFDNLETVLPKPGKPLDERMQGLLKLFQDLLRESAQTRMIFTSREVMPTPFELHTLGLGALGQTQAVALVRNVLLQHGIDLPDSPKGDTHAAIEQLVRTVHGHPRALVLLAPFLKDGISQTESEIGAIMKKIELAHPGNRELSLFASVELSLRRLTEVERKLMRPLAVFQGGFHYLVLSLVLGIEADEAYQLAVALEQKGLANYVDHNYFRMDPALAPYLDLELGEEERVAFKVAWLEEIQQLMGYIYDEFWKDTQLASELFQLELPNLMSALEELSKSDNPEQIINYATNLEQLLEALGLRELIQRVVKIRVDAAGAIREWNHTAFRAARRAIEQKRSEGKLNEAYQMAMSLKVKMLEAGKNAYAGADYDSALAHIVLGRILQVAGQNKLALKEIETARLGFAALVKVGDEDVERMVSQCYLVAANCYRYLGMYDEAIKYYVLRKEVAEKMQDNRGVAVAEGQLGSVYLHQRKYADALQSYENAKGIFEKLKEPKSVATSLHQMGMIYEESQNFDHADRHYREALKIKATLGNPADEAHTLGQLGNLYDAWKRNEEAVIFHQQATDAYLKAGDSAGEGRQRSNLAITLITMGRFEEARTQLLSAIKCLEEFGLQAEHWRTYNILYELEKAVGHADAATQARNDAITMFKQWRQGGAENHSRDAKLCKVVLGSINEGNLAELQAYLEQEIAIDPDYVFYIHLLAILKGSRDLNISEDQGLSYAQVVELELLLEGLKAEGL